MINIYIERGRAFRHTVGLANNLNQSFSNIYWRIIKHILK